MITIYHWIVFNVCILVLLGIDLWQFRKHPEPRSLKDSIVACLGWIALALVFNLWVYVKLGAEPAVNFLTGYLLEESLSVDNLFIFLIIFAHFRVPDACKHLVLFYGVMGAIVMRGLLIWGGIVFVHHFAWAFYLFGAFLIYSGIQLILSKGKSFKIEESKVYKLFSKMVPTTKDYHGQAFWVWAGTKWLATPLLLVLLLIESADLVFALDSVPAILGITTDPFIVYTSNIFAILGLRSLFFVLEKGMNKFDYIHDAVAAILAFIGLKMIIKDIYPIPTYATLGVIVLLLCSAIFMSYAKKNRV